jgi:hypothetical protein
VLSRRGLALPGKFCREKYQRRPKEKCAKVYFFPLLGKIIKKNHKGGAR